MGWTPRGSRQCQSCFGWGTLDSRRFCWGCEKWRKKYLELGLCGRCRHEDYPGPDGICRPCLQAVRLDDDVEWVMAPEVARPRDRQLVLIFRRFAVTNALPLRKSAKGGRRELNRWKLKWEAREAVDRDDAAVLPPAVRGQQALFVVKRAEMSIDTVRSILARPLDGYEEAVAEAVVFAGEYGLSDAWVRQVSEMIRLAMALRDADGHDLVPEEVLDELPSYWTPVGKILTRAGMLQARQTPAPPRRRRPPKSGYVPTPPPPLPPSPRSCRDCDAWMTGVHKRRCHACQTWHGKHKNRPIGQCERCHREGLPLKAGHCRGCCLHVNINGLTAEKEPFTQLWFADPFSVGLRVLRGQLGYELSSKHPYRDRQVAERRAARTPLVPQPAFPGQETLFTMRRDWTPLLDINRRHERLPELTEPAQQLADEFVAMMRDQQWDLDQRVAHLRPLVILLSWLGADAPIREADVVELSRQDVNLSARRVCQFLKFRNMLVEDPALHRDRDYEWIEHTLAGLPEQIAMEVRAWVTVLRGQGRREHEPRSYYTIRSYFTTFKTTLESWIADGVTSLREITNEDVKKAVGARQGNPARSLHIAFRSLFQALKQEQLIFRNPTRGVVVGGVQTLPPAVPSDVLAGLLERSNSGAGRLALALVAVHALPPHEVRHLLTADLDLAKGHLVVRRGLRRHTIHLEEFTQTIAMEWLTERHRRWPGSTNPYLLVSQQTAMHSEHPPVTRTMLKQTFRDLDASMSQLRQDRILHEARKSADPLRLMRLFGISDTTAMRYITAAHPEKTARLPR